MPDAPFVSVIIPAWRDAEALERLLDSVGADAIEVIVSGVVGEPVPSSIRDRHPRVRWIEAPRGRGVQMNAGAAVSRGAWLLFLHADSRLPVGWLEAIRAADRNTDVAGGAFRFALDSENWRARVIETGVRLRVALFGLPYGDQGLFVRKTVFETLAGYRDLALMEDVDLVRRLKRHGRLHLDDRAVLTSARRWERDGWWRRSLSNVRLAALFLLGASPASLARQYSKQRRDAIVVMARAPWVEGKSRLGPALSPDAHRDLRHALFFDTVDAVRSMGRARCIVACDPPDACESLRSALPDDVDVIAQRGTDLGARIAATFEDAWRLGHDRVLVVGSDMPDIPATTLSRALRALGGRGARVVLGPAADGGYYLIGLRAPQPSLFEGVAWSTDTVLVQTVGRAKSAGLLVEMLERRRDVDNAADLRAFAMAGCGRARRMGDWFRKYARDAQSIGVRAEQQ